MSKLLTIDKVMDLLSVKSRQTIYNWVECGKLPPPIKRFGTPRWDSRVIEALIDAENAKIDSKIA